MSIDLNDDQAFIDAAVALCRQPALYSQLGRAARQRVEPQSWARIADDYLAILQQALETSHGKAYSVGL